LPLLAAGDDVAQIARFLKPGCDSYTAAEVLSCLLADVVPVNGLIRPTAHLTPSPSQAATAQ
jgi:hypothetical protein